MSPSVALAQVREYLAAARIQADARERNALLAMAERLVSELQADYTPVQPIVHREELRKSSASFRAVGLALAEGRADAGIATPPAGTPGATPLPTHEPPRMAEFDRPSRRPPGR